MEIKSAVFKKSSPTAVGLFDDGLPHVVFIGRSNVGKSSSINAIAGVKGLAKTSGAPGHTRQINLFLANNTFYIVDLPGYGFVQGSVGKRDALHSLIEEYLFTPAPVPQKIVLIIDAKVGPSHDDIAMLEALEAAGKEIIVLVNKVDRLKSAQLQRTLKELSVTLGAHQIIPFSAEKKIGIKVFLSTLTF